MACAAAGALVALRNERTPWLAGFVLVGFAAGSALLSSNAWQHARRSSLRIAFDELASARRAEAVAAGRGVPEDPSAFAFVEGVLRSDSSAGAAGVSLNLDVDRIRGPGVDRAVRGGVHATVAGSLAPALMGQWRAGRKVQV